MTKRAVKTTEIVVSDQKLNVSLDTEQIVTIFKPFSKTVSWYADSTSSTNFKILVSIDGSNFFEFASASGVLKWSDTKDIAFPWVALKVDAVSGATGNLLLSSA